MKDDIAYHAEQAFLGACLNDKKAYVAGGSLKREHWSDSKHAMIYSAVGQAAQKGQTGPIEVAEELGDFREKYWPYLLELFESCPSPAAAGEYAGIIREHTKLRLAAHYIKDAVGEIETAISQGGLANTSKLLTHLRKTVCDVTAVITQANGYLMFKECVDLAIIERSRKRDRAGIPTTIPRLDFLTGGFSGPTLTVFGARTGIGKSLVGGQIAINAVVRCRRSVGLISLEMGAGQLMSRMLSYLFGEDSIEAIDNAPLYVDCVSRDLDQIVARIREWRMLHAIEICIIDYLQIIHAPNFKQRYEQVGEISRALKSLAMELNIPIVALAQLSREHIRQGRKPTLADLREAGNIEQDADNVFILHCNKEKSDIVELRIEKHRDGPTGEVIDLEFVRERMCLREIL